MRGSAYMYVAVVFVWSREREKIRDGEKKREKGGKENKEERLPFCVSECFFCAAMNE